MYHYLYVSTYSCREAYRQRIMKRFSLGAGLSPFSINGVRLQEAMDCISEEGIFGYSSYQCDVVVHDITGGLDSNSTYDFYKTLSDMDCLVLGQTSFDTPSELLQIRNEILMKILTEKYQ